MYLRPVLQSAICQDAYVLLLLILSVPGLRVLNALVTWYVGVGRVGGGVLSVIQLSDSCIKKSKTKKRKCDTGCSSGASFQLRGRNQTPWFTQIFKNTLFWPKKKMTVCTYCNTSSQSIVSLAKPISQRNANFIQTKHKFLLKLIRSSTKNDLKNAIICSKLAKKLTL